LGDADVIALAERRRLTPAALVAELRRELEWIPLKAMRKDRAQRYRTPGDLADDVRRYLSGGALVAGPESRWYRARKLLYRHRRPAFAAALVGLTLVLGTIATTVQMLRARRAEAEARGQKREAEIRLAETHVSQADALTLAGRWVDADKMYEKARSELASLGRDVTSVDMGDWNLDRDARPPLLDWAGDQSFVTELVFSPDGRFLESGGTAGSLKIWSTRDGRLVQVFSTGQSYPLHAVPSADGTAAFFVSEYGNLWRWNGAWAGEKVGEPVLIISDTTDARCVSASSDGKYLARCGFSMGLELLDARDGKIVRRFNSLGERVEAAVFFPDGKRLVSGSYTNVVKFWSIDSDEPERTVTLLNGSRRVAVSPGGRIVAAAGDDKKIYLIEGDSGEVLRVCGGHMAGISALAFSPDGKTLLSGSWDWSIVERRGRQAACSVARHVGAC
jgi:hypothetical protein